MATKCRYYSCIRVVSERSKHEDCPACRQRYRFWDRQSAARRLERRRKLELSAETMRDFISDTKLKAGVRKGFQKEVRAQDA